jgi:DNA-binding NtrC family response regulator
MSVVVLIVEDETPILMGAEWILQRAGYETASATAVAEALALIESPDYRFNLLFTDISLRDHADGGLTIATAFARSRPGAPVLYTTARGVTAGMMALFVKPSGFVAKPYTAEQLKTAVANLLG